MKTTLFIALAAAAALIACATPEQPPDVARIQLACAADAGIRPSVTELLPLATPAQVAAVVAARAVIDPICRDPAAAQQGAIAGLTAATAKVMATYAEIRARKAASAPG